MKNKGNAKPKRIRIAVVCLTAALLGGLYYFQVDRPVRRGIREATEEREKMESRLSLMQARAENVSGVSNEMDSLTASGNMSWMPSYNSEEEELDQLHAILDSAAMDYHISLSSVTRNQNQIRRGLELRFTAKSYGTAKEILRQLTHGRYRCLISSASLTDILETEETGGVKAAVSATFYETMVGGEPDLGLPSDARGRAVDPMEIGLPAGIAENLDTVKGFVSGEPTIPGLDELTGQSGT